MRGFFNIDVRPVKGVDIVMDLERDELPFESNIVSEIIAKDFLEHIDYNRVELVVADFYRVLKPGGRLWIRVPDVERIVEKYRGDYKQMSYLIFGGKRHAYDIHKTAFTKESIRSLLERFGFKITEMWNDDSNLVVVCIK